MSVRKILTIIDCALCFLLVAGVTILLITRYGSLPEEIATNYDLRGNVTGTSGKGSLVWLQAFNIFSYFMMAYLLFRPVSKGGAVSMVRLNAFKPGIFAAGNLAYRASQKDPVRANNIVCDMLLVLMPAICFLFSFLVLCSVFSFTPGVLLLPVTLAVVIIPTIIAIVRLVMVS